MKFLSVRFGLNQQGATNSGLIYYIDDAYALHWIDTLEAKSTLEILTNKCKLLYNAKLYYLFQLGWDHQRFLLLQRRNRRNSVVPSLGRFIQTKSDFGKTRSVNIKTIPTMLQNDIVNTIPTIPTMPIMLQNEIVNLSTYWSIFVKNN